MRCPQCSCDDTKVLESRLSHEGRSIRRRRACVSCNYRFTTYEREEEFHFEIKKRDGRVEPYERQKALSSIQIACRKRPLTSDIIEGLLASIERQIQEKGDRLVTSEDLGRLILERLALLDPVAYVRFASVYKDFKDPGEFWQELESLPRH